MLVSFFRLRTATYFHRVDICADCEEKARVLASLVSHLCDAIKWNLFLLITFFTKLDDD
jgi:hypothetical protein